MSPPVADIAAACGAGVVQSTPVPGGDANRALRVELDDGRRVFVKYRRGAALDMYRAEADGLLWLADAGAMRVPGVIAIGEGDDPFLALEWLDLRRLSGDGQVAFGRSLARLHRAGAECFGYHRDNYIGPLAQANEGSATWAEFYAERRLIPLARAAATAGGVAPETVAAVERVASRLPDLLGPEEPPARLHGDLWSGNGALCDGLPCIFDPAVHGGHREIDLAMMRLFGGFDERCFAAYHEVYPIAAGAEQRIGLFQLAPLLVHAVLFGAGYGARVAEVAAHYS